MTIEDVSKKQKQKRAVLKYLAEHGEITTMQAVTELGILSLPRRIMELRHDGYAISREYRKTTNGSRYGVYKLEEALG